MLKKATARSVSVALNYGKKQGLESQTRYLNILGGCLKVVPTINNFEFSSPLKGPTENLEIPVHIKAFIKYYLL